MMTVKLAMAAEDSFVVILCRTKSKDAAPIRVLLSRKMLLLSVCDLGLKALPGKRGEVILQLLV
jgi:hypothetical protein